jgi:hypothetical protein
MSSTSKVVGLLFISLVLIGAYLMWSHAAIMHESGGYVHAVDAIQSNERVNYLLNMVRSQNHTIVQMGALLKSQHMHPVSEEHLENHQDSHHDVTVKNAEILKLSKELEENNKHGVGLVEENARLLAENARLKSALADSKSRHSSDSSSDTLDSSSKSLVVVTPPSKIEDMCERRYGLSLLDAWKSKKQVWCGDESAGSAHIPLPSFQSKLVCYPLVQEHRRIARSGGPDTICVAENFVVDFSLVKGGAGGHKLQNYLNFGNGALQSSCKKTSNFIPKKLHKHMQTMMGAYTDGVAADEGKVDKVESTPTYFLIRDEDCENSFHSTADFMNMFVSSNVAGVNPSDQQVVLWDKHPDGPYIDLISKAFSGGKSVLRPKSFGTNKIMFKKIIFHMESPAGLIFPKVANPTQLRCKGTGLFQAYAKHILHSFDLWNVEPPAVPHATLLLRHRTEKKNVGRVLANEKEVIAALADTNMITFTVADTATMPYASQLALIRKTNILIGVHGAGLMLILFAANEAVLLEMHPTYRQDRHFRHASRMAGKDYMPLRAVERETCKGSSDNVKVPIDEFKRTLDGAVRLARGYDDGISECGRQCPAGILALDKNLDSHYGAQTRSKKGPPIPTHFPCA